MRGVVLVLAFSLACYAGAVSASAQQAHAPGQAAAKAQAGLLVYQGHCAVCHSVLPGATLVGPSLYGAMKGPSAGSIRSIIVNGKGRMPGVKPPLSQQEMSSLLAYLKTL